MSDDKQPDVADVIKALGGMPQLALDPATAAMNLATVALLLVMKVIDTVPPAQHAENWERIDRVLDKLRIGQSDVSVRG